MTRHPIGPPSWRLAATGVASEGNTSDYIYDLVLPEGLDGPPGVLHGGLATTLLIDLARIRDRFGAPVTRVRAALKAPTPLATPLQAVVTETAAVGVWAVRLVSGDVTAVIGEVELAGHEPQPRAYDLASLHRVSLPEFEVQAHFVTCWVCGDHADLRFAQALYPRWLDTETVVSTWVAGDDVATSDDNVHPAVAGAVMDCPATWACRTHLAPTGLAGPVLARFDVHFFRDVPAFEPMRVVGRVDKVDGRKFATRGAVIDDDGVTYAVASALHVAVPVLPASG